MLLGLALYVALFIIQLNLFPGERYPGWDLIWIDARAFSNLAVLKQALLHGTLPALDLTTNMGWNLAGDMYPPFAIANVLILFLSAPWVVAIRVWLLFFLGVYGSYYYLQEVTQSKNISFMGAILFLTVPYILGQHHYFCSSYQVYFVPLFLFLIHRLLRAPRKREWVCLLVVQTIAVGYSDINQLLCFPIVFMAYPLLVGYWGLGRPFLYSFKIALTLSMSYLACGGYYFIPLKYNLGMISQQLQLLRQALILPESKLVPIDFFKFFSAEGNLASLVKPLEGSGNLLYTPSFFYSAIVAVFILVIARRIEWKKNRYLLAVVVGSVLLGYAMIAESVVLYSRWTFLLFPKIVESSRGIIRSHINFLPFAVQFAGIVSFHLLSQLKATRLKRGVFSCVFFTALGLDIALFSVGTTHWLGSPVDHSYPTVLKTSNWIPTFVRHHLLLFPLLNAALCLYLWKFLQIPHRPSRLKLCQAVLLGLLAISYHHEAKLETSRRWQWSARSGYRMDSFHQREACVEGLIRRDDLNYRTLYAGKRWLDSPYGRSWMLIIDTEMYTQKGYHSLWAYREMVSPYAALLRSTLTEPSALSLSNHHPPVSDDLVKKIPAMRLMGIKHILSAGAPIDHPDFIFKGSCNTPVGPWDILQVSDNRTSIIPDSAGAVPLYVYELKNAQSVFFWASDVRRAFAAESIREIWNGQQQPWTQSTVLLETDSESAAGGDRVSELPDRIDTLESGPRIRLSLQSSREQHLVLSFVYLPFWKATLDGVSIPVLRAYGGLMAVKIPPGQHQLIFAYQANDLMLGMVISAVSFALCLLLFRPVFVL